MEKLDFESIHGDIVLRPIKIRSAAAIAVSLSLTIGLFTGVSPASASSINLGASFGTKGATQNGLLGQTFNLAATSDTTASAKFYVTGASAAELTVTHQYVTTLSAIGSGTYGATTEVDQTVGNDKATTIAPATWTTGNYAQMNWALDSSVTATRTITITPFLDTVVADGKITAGEVSGTPVFLTFHNPAEVIATTSLDSLEVGGNITAKVVLDKAINLASLGGGVSVYFESGGIPLGVVQTATYSPTRLGFIARAASGNGTNLLTAVSGSTYQAVARLGGNSIGNNSGNTASVSLSGSGGSPSFSIVPQDGNTFVGVVGSDFPLNIFTSDVSAGSKLRVIVDDPDNGLESGSAGALLFESNRLPVEQVVSSGKRVFDIPTSVGTNHPGGLITSNLRFLASESPYRFAKGLEIRSGVTVTVEPGVVMDFSNATSGFAFWVHGTLNLEGTSTGKVTVKVKEGASLFNFEQASNANVSMDHTYAFGGGYSSLYGYSGWGGNLTITNSELYDFQGSNSSLRSLLITDSVLTRIGFLGTIYSGTNQIVLERNLFELSASSTLISFDLTYGQPTSFNIKDNTFANPSSNLFIGRAGNIDLSGNYWPDLTESEIQERILDSSDTLAYGGEIITAPSLASSSIMLAKAKFEQNPGRLEATTGSSILLNPRSGFSSNFTVTTQIFLDLDDDLQLDAFEPSHSQQITFIARTNLNPNFQFKGGDNENWLHVTVSFAGNVNHRNLSPDFLNGQVIHSNSQVTAPADLEYDLDETGLVFYFTFNIFAEGLVTFKLLASETLVAQSSPYPVLLKRARYMNFTGDWYAYAGQTHTMQIQLLDWNDDPVTVLDGDVATLSVTKSGPGFSLSTGNRTTDSDGKFPINTLFGANDVGISSYTITYDSDGAGPREPLVRVFEIEIVNGELPPSEILTTFVLEQRNPTDGSIVSLEGARIYGSPSASIEGITDGFYGETDASGAVRFANLTAGRYTVTVRGPFGSTDLRSQTFSLVLGTESTLHYFLLEPLPTGNLTVTGRVSDLLNQPISGATVSLYSQATESSQVMETDENGIFTFTGLVPGITYVWAEKSGYESVGYSQEFNLAADKSINFTLWTFGSDKVSGTVKSTLNEPLANISVYYEGRFGSPQAYFSGSVRTSSAGLYEIPIPAGATNVYLQTYIEANDRGYFNAGLSINNASSESEADFVLEPIPIGTNKIDGYFRNSITREPVPNAQVSVSFWTSRANGLPDFVSFGTTTDSNGFFEFTQLVESGYVTLNATLIDNGGSDTRAEELKMGLYGQNQTRSVVLETVEVEINSGSGIISGTTLDDRGEPVPYVFVSARRISTISGDEVYGSNSYVARVDSNGYFEITGLPAGNYSLRAYEDMEDMPNISYKPAIFESDYVTLPTALSSVDIGQIIFPLADVGTSSVRTQIWDAKTNTPAAGVVVCAAYLDYQIGGESCGTSDGDGWVTVSNLLAGNHSLTVNRSSNYQAPNAVAFSVGSNQTKLLSRVNIWSINPTSSESSLTVIVRDADDYSPVTSGFVNLSRSNSYFYYPAAPIRADGTAVFPAIEPGNYVVTAYSSSGISLVDSSTNPFVSVVTGQNRAAASVHQLKTNGVVSGFVRDEFGVPVAGAQVNMSFTIYFDCCSGDGYGPSAITDENGYYRLEGVPVGKKLDVNVSAPNFSSSSNPFATLTTTITLPKESPTVTRNYTLLEQGFITGRILRDGGGVSGIEVVAIDNETGREVSRTNTVGGTWKLRNLPTGQYKLAVRSSQWELNSGSVIGIASGFIDKTSAQAARIVYQNSAAEVFTVAGSSTLQVPTVSVDQGSRLSANIKFGAGSTVIQNASASALVEFYRKNSQGIFEKFDALGEIRGYGFWQPNLSVNGIPAGEYKIRFIDSQQPVRLFVDVFQDGKTNLASASSILIGVGEKLALEDVLIPLVEPSQQQNFSILSVPSIELEKKKDAIKAEVTQSTVNVNVGQDFAGRYVAASFEGVGATSAFSVTNTNKVWALVNQQGLISLPRTNASTLAVADVSGRLIGWVQLATPIITPPSGGGGGGGGGGGAPAASKPLQLTRSFFTGTVSSGQTVTGNVGTWEKSENLLFRYQWHRCNKELINPDAPTVQLNCSPIFGAEQISYLVTDSEKEKFLLLEVIARDKTGTLIAAANVFSDTVSFGKTATKPTTVTPTTPTAKPYGITRLAGNKARFQALNPVGKGKISYRLNGREVAWINARNSRDKKIRAVNGTPAFSKTVTLRKGRNTLEIWVKGKRQSRVSITGN